MPSKDQQKNIDRKAAHRKALSRLAEEHDFEYAVFLAQVHREQPNIKADAYSRKAHALLRLKFPFHFHRLFNEEKVKLGLPASPRNWAALGVEIVRLYNNGNGLTRKQIADKLGVSYLTIRRRIQAHQREEMAKKTKHAQELEAKRLGWKQLYTEKGMSIREVCREVNKPYGTVRAGLVAVGTELRDRGGKRGKRNKTGE